MYLSFSSTVSISVCVHVFTIKSLDLWHYNFTWLSLQKSSSFLINSKFRNINIVNTCNLFLKHIKASKLSIHNLSNIHTRKKKHCVCIYVWSQTFNIHVPIRIIIEFFVASYVQFNKLKFLLANGITFFFYQEKKCIHIQ